MGKLGWMLVASLCLAPGARACINEMGTDKDGRQFYMDDHVGKPLLAQMMRPLRTSSYLVKHAPETIARARLPGGFDNENNLGVLLVYQGKYAAAIRYFLSIERRYPGRAQTAANLGTALELAGRDALALRWIRLGIRRDPDEHVGTEWLHVRILEAKLAAAHDPTILAKRSIAGLNFDDEVVPRVPASISHEGHALIMEPHKIAEALKYQLTERMGFVAPRDPVVANLLHDWALLHLAGGSLETANAAFDAAITYGWPRDARMTQRKAYIIRVLAGPKRDTTERCAICWQPTPPPEDGEPPPPPPASLR
jgi:hypothetical protein